MIRVTRLNGAPLFVNADLIETVSSTPDTLITLTTGTKLMVAETVGDVVREVINYKRLLTERPLVAEGQED